MNIVVLCGGLSQERDVSLLSGQLVAKALKKLGHKVVTIDLYFGYTGTYHDPRELFTEEHTLADLQISEDAPDLETVKKSRKQANNSLIGDNVIEVCRAADLTFLALHGAEGENGKLQGLFDLLDIRYTGCGSLASAIAMNKDLAKKVMAEAGVRVPGGITVHAGSPSYPLPSLPCVVKPKSGGSSIGTSLVFKEEEYLPALELGFRYEDTLLVEDYIKGRECDVGVLMGEALPVIEICPKTGFYDYKNKYQAGLTDEYCPADLPIEAARRLQKAAETVYRAIGMEVYGRMDFILREDGEIFCLEANTLPGMTPMSLMPQEAAAVGISYEGLCEEIVKGSLAKYES